MRKGGLSMATEKINLEKVAALTKELFHAHYAGDLDKWFSYLCPDSVYGLVFRLARRCENTLHCHMAGGRRSGRRGEARYFGIQWEHRHLLIHACSGTETSLSDVSGTTAERRPARSGFDRSGIPGGIDVLWLSGYFGGHFVSGLHGDDPVPLPL